MTERLQPPASSQRTARRRWGPRTVPVPPPRTVSAENGPTILGFPAELPEEDDEAELSSTGAEPVLTAPAPALLAIRRADPVGAGALVLAGVAANVSLSLSWSAGEGPSGLSLVRRGGEALSAGMGEAARSGVWQPLVVVASGGLLVVLGFLLLVPARAHRFVGLLALVVALSAAAAVALLIADTDLADDRLGPGMWSAIAVPVLGVLGALKAMLTAPRVALVRAEAAGARL